MPQITDPRQLFTYKLGDALTMEKTVLEMLHTLEQRASDEQLKQQFAHHAKETEGQIKNVEQAFSALGQDPQPQSCAGIQGIKKEGEEIMGKVSPDLLDVALLGAASATEHYEISVYEGLLTEANAMGEEDLVGLLQENLDQETHTRDEVKRQTERLAQQLAQTAA